jgi:hypothetical protein
MADVGSNKPTAFKNLGDAQRVIEAVKVVESKPWQATPPQGQVIAWNPALQPAVATSTINAGNSSVYGTGTCTIMLATHNSNTNTYSDVTNPAYNSVTCYNRYNSNINSNTNIQVYWHNGIWLYGGGDC